MITIPWLDSEGTRRRRRWPWWVRGILGAVAVAGIVVGVWAMRAGADRDVKSLLMTLSVALSGAVLAIVARPWPPEGGPVEEVSQGNRPSEHPSEGKR
jgi:quinol-cytochrome oxidoreductase complex cytochrome b subunit